MATNDVEPHGPVESRTMIEGGPADAPPEPSRWRTVLGVAASIPELAFIVLVLGAFFWLTIIEPLKFAAKLWNSSNVAGATAVISVVIIVYASAIRDIRRKQLNWASAILLGILVLCTVVLFVVDLVS